MYKGTKRRFFVALFPELPQQRQGECTLLVFCVTERQGDCNIEYVTVQDIECTVCNWTVLTVITERQSDCYLECVTAHHIECTESLLTVITQKLPLNDQLNNSTAHLLYKYCTNCTVCNWTVFTVIKKKLPLLVQLHNSTQSVSYCLLKWRADACSKLYSHTYTEIRSFRLTPLAVSAVS
jgi:hypothetical protein